jgi:hypothetical protein
MLSINQHFGKHCICHLQGKCVVGQVLESLGQAVGGELDLMVIGVAEERAAVQWERRILQTPDPKFLWQGVHWPNRLSHLHQDYRTRKRHQTGEPAVSGS